MVILVLAVVPVTGMLEAGMHAVTSSGGYAAARALANERLEEAHALPYRAGPTPPPTAPSRVRATPELLNRALTVLPWGCVGVGVGWG